jgi:ketosteroid isomerase-like protein
VLSEEALERLGQVLDQLFESRRLDPEILAPDAEWVNPCEAVEPGTRRGADEFNRAIASIFATWDDVHFDRERVIESGEHAVALGTLRGHLHESGMEVTASHGQVWTFQAGRVKRMRWFNTHGEALEAAGLPPNA